MMEEPVASRLAREIAEAKGIEADELTVSLQDYIELDAIELLERNSDSSWTLTFDLPEYTVTITRGDEVTVKPRSQLS